MTAREQADFEEGRSWGYCYPRRTVLWPKSDAWCAGVRAGQAEYWKDYHQKQKRARAIAKIEREFYKTRDAHLSKKHRKY